MSKVKTVKNVVAVELATPVQMFSPEGVDAAHVAEVEQENDEPVIAATKDGIRTELVDDMGGLTITFGGVGRLELDVASLSPAIIKHALLHGLKQKLVDAAAIARNRDTGRSATLEDKYDAVREVFNRITGANGQPPSWNTVAKGPGSSSTGGLLLAALCILKPEKTQAQLRAWLDTQDNAAKQALKNNPRVNQIILDLKAKSAQKGQSIDTDSLLDNL